MSTDDHQTHLQRLALAGRWRELVDHTRALPLAELLPSELEVILHFESLGLFRMGHLADAWRTSQQALRDNPENPSLCDLAARIALEANMQEYAVSLHLRAIHFSNATLVDSMRFNYALSLHRLGRHEEALAELNAESADFVGDLGVRAWMLMAQCYVALHQWSDALFAYGHCIMSNDSGVNARMGIANALAAMGELERAERAFESLQGQGADHDVAFNWSYALVSMGQPHRAARVAINARQHIRDSEYLRCVQALALAEMSAFDSALDLLNSSLSEFNDRPEDAERLDRFASLRADLRIKVEQFERARAELLHIVQVTNTWLPGCHSKLAQLNGEALSRLLPFTAKSHDASGAWRQEVRLMAHDIAHANALVQEYQGAQWEVEALEALPPIEVIDPPRYAGVFQRDRWLALQM